MVLFLENGVRSGTGIGFAALGPSDHRSWADWLDTSPFSIRLQSLMIVSLTNHKQAHHQPCHIYIHMHLG
jgi:hypothetical protein